MAKIRSRKAQNGRGGRTSTTKCGLKINCQPKVGVPNGKKFAFVGGPKVFSGQIFCNLKVKAGERERERERERDAQGASHLKECVYTAVKVVMDAVAGPPGARLWFLCSAAAFVTESNA